MAGRDKFVKYEILINLFSNIISFFPLSWRKFLFSSVRGLKGTMGIFFRYVLIRKISHSCGKNVCIKENVYIYNIEKISFGNNISIHPMCYLDGCGGISIGDNVSIAHNTSLISFNHTHKQKNIPIKYNPIECGHIYIERDVWIGCGTRILSGVSIGTRAIVAAGSVVNKNVEEFSIYGGVPSKLIKYINH